MAFQLVAYDHLVMCIKQSIGTLVKHHTGRESDLEQLTEATSILTPAYPVRRTQTEFLLKTIELTGALTNDDMKARILNAASYYIYEQVKAEYSMASPGGSVLYTSLRTSLNLEQGKPNDNDLWGMYGALHKFLCSHVYNQGEPRKGYLDDQRFSKVHQYNPVYDIKFLKQRLDLLEQQAYDEAERLHKSAQRPENPAGGLLSWLGGVTSARFVAPPPSDNSLRPM